MDPSPSRKFSRSEKSLKNSITEQKTELGESDDCSIQASSWTLRDDGVARREWELDPVRLLHDRKLPVTHPPQVVVELLEVGVRPHAHVLGESEHLEQRPERRAGHGGADNLTTEIR